MASPKKAATFVKSSSGRIIKKTARKATESELVDLTGAIAPTETLIISSDEETSVTPLYISSDDEPVVIVKEEKVKKVK